MVYYRWVKTGRIELEPFGEDASRGHGGRRTKAGFGNLRHVGVRIVQCHLGKGGERGEESR